MKSIAFLGPLIGLAPVPLRSFRYRSLGLAASFPQRADCLLFSRAFLKQPFLGSLRFSQELFERVALGLNKVELGLPLLRNPRRPLSLSNIPGRAQEGRRCIGFSLERHSTGFHEAPCAIGPNELVL